MEVHRARINHQRIRIVAVLMAFTMLIFVIPSPIQVRAEGLESHNWDAYGSTYVYNSMTSVEKHLYDGLYDSCKKYLTTEADATDIYENGIYYMDYVDAGSLEDIASVVEAFKEANPQFYFIGANYFIVSNGTNRSVVLEMDSKFVYGSERTKITNQIFSKADSWISKASAGKTTRLEKEIAVNDIICENVVYGITENSMSIYSTFVEGTAVCQGYSLAASLMLNAMGIPTMCVTSKNHEWNKVCLDDGTWYALDVTWNDTWNGGFAHTSYYDKVKNIFANRSDENIKMLDTENEHIITGPKYYPVSSVDYPRAESNEYNLEISNEGKVITVLVTKADNNDADKDEVVGTVTLEGSTDESAGSMTFDTSTYQRDKSSGGSDSNGSSSNAGGSNGSSSNAGTSNAGVSNGSTSNAGTSNAGTSNVNTSNGNTSSAGNAGNGSVTNGGSASPEQKYSNEWINGKWYDANGLQSYEGELQWKSNAAGWWVEDTSGWYPVSQWQKIDGSWYYFGADGYMASNEWRGGCWLSSSGAWEYEATGMWKGNSSGWWYEDTSGWYPAGQWLKVDGYWYYFGSDGYMVTSVYIDGYWIGSDGICQ